MRKVSPALFVLAALSFLLPFASVACNPASFTLAGAVGGSGDVTVSGSDMALGTWPIELDIPGTARGSRLPGPGPNPLAVLVFAGAMGGLTLAVPRSKRWFWDAIGGAVGGLAAGSLVLLRSTFQLEVDELVGQARWRYGWWVAVTALALAGVFNLALVIRSGVGREEPTETAPP